MARTPQDVVRTLPTSEFLIDISRGLIPGAEPFGAYGERTASAGETNHVIWPNGTFSIPPAEGVQMSIVSDSPNDAAGGTGIQSVHVHYLDTNRERQDELVAMNGTTPVLMQAENNRFVQFMHIGDVGALGVAAGTITISHGGTIYGQIAANDTRCSSSARMVPAGKRLFIAGAAASSISGTAQARAQIKMVTSEVDTHQYIDPLVLIPFASVGVQDGSEAMVFPMPIPLSEGMVAAMMESTDKIAIINGSWFGWIENA